MAMFDMESSSDKHIKAFNIGFFSSHKNAEKTAKRYLAEVSGFKEYNVTYQITEKCVIDCNDSLRTSELFIIYGWNEYDELIDNDVIQSDCYTNRQEAEHKLNELKSRFSRDEWCIDRYRIDEYNWQEGFVKVFH